MEFEDIMKSLDAILDKYGIVENREAIKADIFDDVISDAWNDGRKTGRDTYWKWND